MCRNVKELLSQNVPYSEMTEEEIDLMVEYRATLKYMSDDARDARNSRRENETMISNMLHEQAQVAQRNMSTLIDTLLSHGGA